MGGFDIYVRSDPSVLTLNSAALGTLIVSPSLTSICINGSPSTGSCTPGTANGVGVVEVTTIESSGGNECGSISPCSGLAFTITYTVFSAAASTTLSYPTALGCAASSVASPINVCVEVADSIGTILSENVLVVPGTLTGATVTQNVATKDPTSTVVLCSSPVVVGVATSCTATVTDTATTGATNPTGTVTFSTSGAGTFSPNPCPTLTASGTTAASCTVMYTPTAVGTGTHSITAKYNGDATHSTSMATAPVTVNKATPTITTGVSSPIIVGSSTIVSSTLTGGFPSTGITGSVTYNRFAGTGCTGTATLIATVTVGAANSVPTASDTPSAAGSYSYQAAYSGDGNNNVATGTCANLAVNKVTITSLTTAATSPITVGSSTTVSATLVGGFPSTGVTGTVTYTRFAVSGCTGTGTNVATVTIGAANAVPLASDTPPSAGSFSYQASYSGDTNNNAFPGTCVTVTVNKTNITSLTTAATSLITVGSSTSLSATLVGGFPATGVTGSVSYMRFAVSGCTGTGTTVATVTIGAANAVPGATNIPPSAGSFSYQASYSGDSNNNVFTGTCANVTVSKTSITSLVTAVNPSSITTGQSTTVSAVLTGGFPATGVTGSVTYTRFSGAGCSGTGTTVATVTVGAADSVPTATDAPTASSSYQGSYSGDTNNNSFPGTCVNLTVSAKPSPTLATVIRDSTNTGVTSITVGAAVHDTATITPPTGITTPISGQVTYTLFSFAALPSATTPCIGGTTVGTPQVVTIGAGNAVPDATPVTPSSAGFYGYSASYGGDTNYAPSTSNCEPLTVNKTTITSLTTAATSPIMIGSSTTVSATLVGGFPSTGVTGSVTYTRFAVSGCAGTGTTVATVTIGAANAVPSASNSPPSAGSFSYQASYSGDINNNAFTGTCANVTVNKTNITSLTTGATSPITAGSSTTLSAALVGGFPSTGVTGTVTYTRFTGSGCTGTGTTIATVTIGAGNSVPSASDTPPSAGSFSYQASYSGDTNNNSFLGTCAVVTVQPPGISLTTSVTSPITVGSSTTVSATLVGGFPSTGVTGSVTYTRFAVSGCTGTGSTVATVTIGAGNSVPTASDSPSPAGSYSYQASYSGDTNNNAFTGTCADLTVNKVTPSVTTAVSPSTITIGASATDLATVSGGFSSSGTVTYTAYSDAACATLVFTSANVPLGTASAAFTPSTAGTYLFKAAYSGDANNNAVTTTCGAAGETLTVTAVVPFDYALSNNGPVSIVQGSSGTVTITATLTAGSAVAITLSCVAPLPTGVTCRFGTNPVTPTGTSVLTIGTSGSTPTGSFSLMVTGSPLGATTAPTSVSVTITAPVVGPTTTTIACAPGSVLVSTATVCTARVTDMSLTPTTPTGTISFTTNSTGTFSPAATCALVASSGKSTATCTVSYTSTVSGQQMITGAYSGDSSHAQSSGSFILNVRSLAKGHTSLSFTGFDLDDYDNGVGQLQVFVNGQLVADIPAGLNHLSGSGDYNAYTNIVVAFGPFDITSFLVQGQNTILFVDPTNFHYGVVKNVVVTQDGAILLHVSHARGVYPGSSVHYTFSNPPLSIDSFTSSSKAAISNQVLSFGATYNGGTGPFTCIFRFGDHESKIVAGRSGTCSAIHDYDIPGTFTATVTVRGSSTSDLITSSLRINVSTDSN